MTKFKVHWKWMISFSKKEWEISDYPIKYRKQKVVGEDGLETVNWIAQIVNWWALSGLGNTKYEALIDLTERFENFKQENVLPRPGKNVPLQFAPASEIDKFEDIAVKFFDKVLDINYHDCFISDESNIYHFDIDKEEILKLINDSFNTKFDDLGSGNLVELFKRIKESK